MSRSYLWQNAVTTSEQGFCWMLLPWGVLHSEWEGVLKIHYKYNLTVGSHKNFFGGVAQRGNANRKLSRESERKFFDILPLKRNGKLSKIDGQCKKYHRKYESLRVGERAQRASGKFFVFYPLT